MTSSSVSCLDCLPATSALVIAVSTIRNVDDRRSSRALIAVVRSARRRSLRSLMAPLWQPCRMRPGQSTWTRALGGTLGVGALTGVAAVTYAAAIEIRAYTLRTVDL